MPPGRSMPRRSPTRPTRPRWLAVLDARPQDDESGDGRLGLHGRVESQAVFGEPVLPISDVSADGWVRVVCPWQPSRLDPCGYPGWVRRSHLEDPGSAGDEPGLPVADAPGADVLTLAAEHLGLPYLWGGTSPLGLDCSGLVHHVWRRLGVVVPRDADDQEAAAYPVAFGEERPGDLYFFAHPGRAVHHVGIVSAPWADAPRPPKRDAGSSRRRWGRSARRPGMPWDGCRCPARRSGRELASRP
jgi:hypothetical protein